MLQRGIEKVQGTAVQYRQVWFYSWRFSPLDAKAALPEVPELPEYVQKSRSMVKHKSQVGFIM